MVDTFLTSTKIIMTAVAMIITLLISMVPTTMDGKAKTTIMMVNGWAMMTNIIITTVNGWAIMTIITMVNG